MKRPNLPVIFVLALTLCLGLLIILATFFPARQGVEAGATLTATASAPGETFSKSPTSSPTLRPYSVSLECHDEHYRYSERFLNFREVWTSSTPFIKCRDLKIVGDFLTTDQENAIEALGDKDFDEGLRTLSVICASMNFPDDGQEYSPYSDEEITNIHAALLLCPDQPGASTIQAKIEAGHGADQRGEDETQQEVSFRAGLKRVGVDVQPGTYASEGEVENCYWERLDSSGNIIDNNFISTAFRVEVSISGDDYSFFSSGCGGWVRQN